MYKDIEIETSYKYLNTVISRLKEPICILGGWAVFFTVKDNYQKQTGRVYIGSRDIDIGFNDTITFKEAAKILEKKLNFTFLSFRYYKTIHAETGKDLTEEQAKSLPQHMSFPLYVDPIMSFVDNKTKTELGFTPIDEPLLKQIFEDKQQRTKTKEFGIKLLLPSPQILLATKLNSILSRYVQHKKQKDMCDIIGLCLFSGIPMNKIIKEGNSFLTHDKREAFRTMNFDIEINQCSEALGLNTNTVKSIINKIKEY